MFTLEESRALGLALSTLSFPEARDVGIAIRAEDAKPDSSVGNLPPAVLAALNLEQADDTVLGSRNIVFTRKGMLAFGFNPGQARVPKNNPNGGEWKATPSTALAQAKAALGSGSGLPKTSDGQFDETNPTFTGDTAEVPPVRNDSGMSHDDITGEMTDSRGRAYGPAAELSNRVHEEAVAAEPQLTADMREAVAGTGTELAGLEYRIKNQTSTAKKVRGNLDKGADASTQNPHGGIKDSVRYTAVLPTEGYTDGVHDTLERLRAKGYQVDVKNFYAGDLASGAYKGVHGQMTSPDGFKVELQFHTGPSLAAKNGLHKIYDEQKLVPEGSAEWKAYDQQMLDLMDSVGFVPPPGAEDIT